MQIWLFDLDGVLIYPGGYRAALKATVNHFTRAMGLGDYDLADPTIETFEACGITSEWDSSPICVAVLLAEIWRADPTLRLPADFDQALSAVRSHAPQRLAPDLAAWARRISQAMSDTDLAREANPSDAALKLLQDDARRSLERNGRLVELDALLRQLLERNRDLLRSPTMRVFQHYTMGSRAFGSHYGSVPSFETPSLLRDLDRPALSSSSRDMILELASQGKAHPVIYTARPGQPRTLPGRPEDCAPEAEIALDLIGLADLPLATYGHLTWLAAQYNQRPDYFVKPSPVHALTAMAMAIGGSEREALETAYALVREGRLVAPLSDLRGRRAEVHVFEDSARGIRGVREAARLLEQAGIHVDARAWGIADHPEKRRALESLDALTFANVDQAIQAAMQPPDKMV
jgi:phosphoglycolate phosphatase-like HAD superfamily hydrolase